MHRRRPRWRVFALVALIGFGILGASPKRRAAFQAFGRSLGEMEASARPRRDAALGDEGAPPERGSSPGLQKDTATPSDDGARGNQRISDFAESKKRLRELYARHPGVRSFYCDCPFSGPTLGVSACGLASPSSRSRLGRIEWEHVVPASAFGHTFSSWTTGDASCKKKGRPYKGRKCAHHASKRFRLMEADMHNLFPVSGAVNQARGNLPMGIVPGEPRVFGRCDAETDAHFFEPRPAIRGDIARAYLYMEWAYPGRRILPPERRALLSTWADADPPDAWEIERNLQIEKLQGNANPFITMQAARQPTRLRRGPL